MAIFSFRQIITLANADKKITNTQSAKQALRMIKDKYGVVSADEKFYYRGAGDWARYSFEDDKHKASKVVKNKHQWENNPQRFDLAGVDTNKKDKKQIKVTAPLTSVQVQRTTRQIQKKIDKKRGIIKNPVGRWGNDYTIYKIYSSGERKISQERNRNSTLTDGVYNVYEASHGVGRFATGTNKYYEVKDGKTKKLPNSEDAQNRATNNNLKTEPYRHIGKNLKAKREAEREAEHERYMKRMEEEKKERKMLGSQKAAETRKRNQYNKELEALKSKYKM
jgi:hypothetical protein